VKAQDGDVLTVILTTFLLGAFIGSFLNVCVHRLPRNESVVHPPSRCYACGTHLSWYDNLPILGWLMVWGRCRACGTHFSSRYLFAELAVGALTAGTAVWLQTTDLVWQRFGYVSEMVAFGLAFTALLVLVWNLYVSSLIDLDHYIIPDELTKSFQLLAPFLAVLAGTGMAIEAPLPESWAISSDAFGVVTQTPMHLLAWMGGIGGGSLLLLALSVPVARVIYSTFTKEAPWTEDDHRGFRTGVWWFMACTAVHLLALTGMVLFQPGSWWLLASLLLAQAILGSLAGWFSLYLVGFLGTIAFRKNAMGFGDVKFLAPIGAFLGPVGVLYAFFAAAIIGTLIGVPMLILRSTRVVPFGPYLAMGALLALVLGGWFHQLLFAGFF
jgi:leader peptidase (prepilin peptidase)/N-methyltransferase